MPAATARNTALYGKNRSEPLIRLDPAFTGAGILLSPDRLTGTSQVGAWNSSRVSVPKSGKRYLEGLASGVGGGTTAPYAGLSLANAAANFNSYFGDDANAFSLWSYGNVTRYADSWLATTPFGSGQIPMLAYDTDADLVWFGLDGAWLLGGNPAAGTGGQLLGLGPVVYAGLIANGLPGALTIKLAAANQSFLPPAGFRPYNAA
jgi:hypothetical protein